MDILLVGAEMEEVLSRITLIGQICEEIRAGRVKGEGMKQIDDDHVSTGRRFCSILSLTSHNRAVLYLILLFPLVFTCSIITWTHSISIVEQGSSRTNDCA